MRPASRGDPKLELKTGRVRGAEALIRWQHPRDGLLSPAQFIPLAEHTGMIKPLSLWVLSTALVQCRAWRESGLDLGVAVNLSPLNLQDEHLACTIAGLIEGADSSSSWLTVEITEDALMSDMEAALAMIARLRGMGVRISIDDFGTGRSSLAYLKDLPVDEIKIDRSFIKGMATDRSAAAIVRSVIDLGSTLGLQVVAEGIEDDATLDRLAGMGCGYAQGYYLGPPLPPAEFTEWLVRRPEAAPRHRADGAIPA